MKVQLTTGCQRDVDAFVRRLRETRDRFRPHWSDETFCHRLVGRSNFLAMLQGGRVTMRKLAAGERALDKFIEGAAS